MKTVVRVLLAIIVLELAGASYFLMREASKTVPLMPDVRLIDPTIMPQLQKLAEAAEEGNDEDWRRLGEALIGKGFYSHAELAFQEALRRDPSNFLSQFGLAFCLDRTGRMQESTVAYGKLIQLPAETPDQQLLQLFALYGMGRNALRQESSEEAAMYFQQNADYPPAEYQLAKLWIRSGKPEQVLPLIEKNLANIPYSLGFHFLNERAQQALGNDQAAFLAATMVERSAYLVSQNFNTDYVAPLDARTGISARMSELHEAIEEEDTQRIATLSKEIRSIVEGSCVAMARTADNQLLTSLIKQKQPRKAIDLIDSFRAHGRIDALTLENEGDAMQLIGRTDLAMNYWQRALDLQPSIELHEKLAANVPAEDESAQNYHLSRAAHLAGLVEYRSNRLKGAMPHFLKAIELDATNPDPWFYLGEMHFHLNEPEEAIQAYQRCLELKPEHGRAASKLAYLEQEMRE